jgi:hypothetical protein
VRREEQLLPRAGKSTDRDGTDEDLSERVFHMPFPLAPARPESHVTRGQARSPRPAHANHLRCIPAAAGVGRVSWRLATLFISYVSKKITYR